jgi:hypothetical protein
MKQYHVVLSSSIGAPGIPDLTLRKHSDVPPMLQLGCKLVQRVSTKVNKVNKVNKVRLTGIPEVPAITKREHLGIEFEHSKHISQSHH